MSEPTRIYICKTCRPADFAETGERPGTRLARALAAEVEARGLGGTILVEGVNCFSVCTRPCCAAVAAPGKFSYVIGDVDAVSGGADLLAFALAYAEAPDGIPPWRSRPESVRKATVARVPPPGHAAAPVEPVEPLAPETGASD